jgi:hypothetical protein
MCSPSQLPDDERPRFAGRRRGPTWRGPRRCSHWPLPARRVIVGELKGLAITVSATSGRKVLLEEGLQPAPERSHSSWRVFLRAQAASMLACDFLTVETAFLQRIYVLFFISLATRIEYIASSSNPDGHWVTQQARNLFMRLGDEHPFANWIFVAQLGVTAAGLQRSRAHPVCESPHEAGRSG